MSLRIWAVPEVRVPNTVTPPSRSRRPAIPSSGFSVRAGLAVPPNSRPAPPDCTWSVPPVAPAPCPSTVLVPPVMTTWASCTVPSALTVLVPPAQVIELPVPMKVLAPVEKSPPVLVNSPTVSVRPEAAPKFKAPALSRIPASLAICSLAASRRVPPSMKMSVVPATPSPRIAVFGEPVLARVRVPPLTVVEPVKVLAAAPDRVQPPVPVLTRLVVLVAELFTIAPAISPSPAVEPCSVRVLLPAPVAVKSLVNLSRPVPEWSITALAVVPRRLTTRSVVSPVPT